MTGGTTLFMTARPGRSRGPASPPRRAASAVAAALSCDARGPAHPTGAGEAGGACRTGEAGGPRSTTSAASPSHAATVPAGRAAVPAAAPATSARLAPVIPAACGNAQDRRHGGGDEGCASFVEQG